MARAIKIIALAAVLATQVLPAFAGPVANCKALPGRRHNLKRSACHDPVKKDTKKSVHIALRPRT